MKKTVKLILLALCTAILFGCSNTTSKTDSNTSATSSADSKQQGTVDNKNRSSIEILTGSKTAKKFTTEPICEDHIRQILQAGLNAPSARNSQPWHFSVVTNKEILKQINEAVLAGMPKGAPGVQGTQNDKRVAPPKKLGLTDAPAAIFVYGTSNLSTDPFDCGLATEAMSIAALSLGYGTKIMASPAIALNSEKKADFDKLLQIPQGYSFVSVLIIGRNDESIDASTGASPRKSMEEKVRFIN